MQNRSLRYVTCAALVMVQISVARGSEADDVAIDIQRAAAYFAEARELSDRDAGHLWGKKLYGPMLFVDRATRQVVANEPDKKGLLRERNGLFTGRLPEKVNVANTSTQWNGVHWTMIVWPLPKERNARARLMAHELWHRIQDQIGLAASNPENAHLDARDGRLWLRMEWAALASALASEGDARRAAVVDALIFRAHRRSQFPEAAKQERSLEMHEGLAEYTGVKLSTDGLPAAADQAARGLAKQAEAETYVRSFAYGSGPAYGLLLDDARPVWRSGLSANDDLGDLLASALSIELPADLEPAVLTRAAGYGFDLIRDEEDVRERRRLERLIAARNQFIDGPILLIPLRQMNIEFNPSNLMPIDDAGTLYPTLRIVDVWGVLTVSEGALVSSDWRTVRVTAPVAPLDRPLRGDGWELELDDGWKVEPGKRPGDYRLSGSKHD